MNVLPATSVHVPLPSSARPCPWLSLPGTSSEARLDMIENITIEAVIIATFDALDADDDGRFNFEDWIAMLSRMHLHQHMGGPKARRVFNRLDHDGNGYVQRREFYAVARQLMDHLKFSRRDKHKLHHHAKHIFNVFANPTSQRWGDAAPTHAPSSPTYASTPTPLAHARAPTRTHSLTSRGPSLASVALCPPPSRCHRAAVPHRISVSMFEKVLHGLSHNNDYLSNDDIDAMAEQACTVPAPHMPARGARARTRLLPQSTVAQRVRLAPSPALPPRMARSQCDLDGSGVIDFEEFHELLHHHHLSSYE